MKLNSSAVQYGYGFLFGVLNAGGVVGRFVVVVVVVGVVVGRFVDTVVITTGGRTVGRAVGAVGMYIGGGLGFAVPAVGQGVGAVGMVCNGVTVTGGSHGAWVVTAMGGVGAVGTDGT